MKIKPFAIECINTINHSLTSPGEAIGKEECDRLMDELHAKVIGFMTKDVGPGLLCGIKSSNPSPCISKIKERGGPDGYGGSFNVWA